MTRDLAAAANRNLRVAYRGPAEFLDGGETRTFGTITAAATGLPISNFNRLAVLEEPSPADLDAAIDWLADREATYRVTVTEPVLPAVDEALADRGLVETGQEPAMAMSMPPAGEIPDPPPAIEFDSVRDEAGLSDFVEIAAAAFGFPVDLAQDLMAPAAVEAPGLAFLVGRVEGEAVACGQLVRSADAAGVYSIGVREDHREQGFGEATSWAVLRAGRDAGCEVGVLQAAAGARSIYERMGFEPVVTYHYLEPEG